MTRQTPLYERHVAAGGKMVEFGGWQLPVNYGSQIAEHVAVREAAGMFDVSHMTIIDISGEDARDNLRYLIANDVDRLELWSALYGAMLNETGGVIDDLIVYRLPDGYRCVVNASTRDRVLDWMRQRRSGDVVMLERELAMIAVQGPKAVSLVSKVTGCDFDALKPFQSQTDGKRVDWLFARTGYTGEDGLEIMLPAADAVDLWDALIAQDVTPAGLGARDTLRLEAGLNLYGQDMDEATSPLASNIGWTIAWEPPEREFIGRQAIEPARRDCAEKLTGLLLADRGILRHGQTVRTDAGVGVVTSGTFSPTLERSIGLARVPAGAAGTCRVEIRGREKNAEIVKPPFVRNGKIRIEL